MWHSNGVKKLERTFIDGKKHGACTQWDEQGNKVMVAMYEHGVLTGELTFWNADGSVASRAKAEDVLEKLEKDPDPKNELFIQAILDEVVLLSELTKDDAGAYRETASNAPYTGWFVKRSDAGDIELLGRMKEGQPAGTWTWWNENGVRAEQKTFELVCCDQP